MTQKSNTSDIWTQLLASVAAGARKSLHTRTIIVLSDDGTQVTAFIDALRQALPLSKDYRRRKADKAPANFSSIFGYTYIDIEDPETDDVLARLDIFAIKDDEAAYSNLLLDVLQDCPVEEVLVYILLDWHYPWTWLRSLRDRIDRLKHTIESLRKLSTEKDLDLDENTKKLELQLRSYSETGSSIARDPNSFLPLEKGQFEDRLGIPLICVAQNAEYMYALENEFSYTAEQFDFIQQTLRTVLLWHGASLHYTAAREESDSTLLHALIHTHFKEIVDDIYPRSTPPAATVVERDIVYVPAGWDSWNKISYFRDGYDPAGTAELWRRDLSEDGGSLVNVYEEVIKDARPKLVVISDEAPQNVPFVSHQAFLQILEKELKESSSQDLTQRQEIEDNTVDIRQTGTRNSGIDPDEIEERLKLLRIRPDSQPTTPSGLSKTGQPKDEYVQAFFQNLLDRNRESKS